MFKKLNLQLFAEQGIESSVENQEVAELETEVTEGTEENQSTSEEGTEVAGQSTDETNAQTQPRDFEKDSAYAKMRREMEQTKKQNEMLAKTFQQFGFKGTPEEIIDQANAHYLQKPIEEVRQQRIQQEQQQAAEAQRQAELDFYRNKEIERLMDDDLKKIQKLDPTVKSLNDLGQDFFDLKAAGIDAEIAFGAIQQKKQRETKIPPTEIGKVNSGSKEEKDFYTSAEVDKLTKKDLANPKIMARVMESMTKW